MLLGHQGVRIVRQEGGVTVLRRERAVECCWGKGGQMCQRCIERGATARLEESLQKSRAAKLFATCFDKIIAQRYFID